VRAWRSRASIALTIGYWATVVLAVAATAVTTALATSAPVVDTEPGDTLAALTGLLPSLIAVVAIVVGITRNEPTRRWPWLLVALTIGAWSIGGDVYADLVRHPALTDELTMLGAVDLLYAVGFVTLAAALLRLRRSSRNGLAPAGVLDTLTVTLILLLLVWVTVISPDGPGPWALGDPTVAVYLLGDALIVATAVRLVIVGPPTPAVLALVGAAAARFVADLAHGLTASGTTGSLGILEVIGSGLAAGCLGWAALDPSMTRLTESETEPARRPSLRRFWVFALPALVVPVILFAQAVAGRVHDGMVLAVLGAALTLVALARVAATGESQSRSLAYRARTDTLTGLANRIHLMECLADTGGPRWSAVVLVDLDEFRQLNDEQGPSVGDEVLATLAGRLRRLGGPEDLVARFGGDEFAILVAAADRDIAALTTEVVAATGAPVLIGRHRLPVSACVGIAVRPESGSSTTGSGPGPAAGEEMLRRAGLALRAAKAAGPGEWCRYDSDRHGQLIERIRLRESLHRAVDEGSFQLSYQPIVEIATDATVGFEALVRWTHPTRGIIQPSEFISVAEEAGLIEPIGDLVLRTAVTEAAGWSSTAEVYISVNVSPLQLRGPGFADRVEEVLLSSGHPAHRLVLELTESVVTTPAEHVWVELAALRDMGVRLALDDFGTGFSSLSYLEQTPIGVIKMDKSFVDSLVPSDRQRRVVAGILAMAHDIGLEVVAEGVETTAERDLLAELGCRFGQGYLYAPPLSSTEVVRWLTHPAMRSTGGAAAGTVHEDPDHEEEQIDAGC
jgi:diguanylate cyclase (GGDEF)-like protein